MTSKINILHSAWLTVTRGNAPLLVSLPHTGTDIPDVYADGLRSPWLARRDADWWVDRLYAFAESLGATIVHTAISRTVIDVNRNPSGASLYPGQATTELCPTTTFDGDPLYWPGNEPDAAGVAERRARFFDPYHAALAAEVARLRETHPRLVVYDCHSIRSEIPRLFNGVLPHFNIGTNDGAACAPGLADAVFDSCATTGFSHVLNGRFKGGFITRSVGHPDAGVDAIQMELSCRGYLAEPPEGISERNWPPPYDETTAAPMRAALQRILSACLAFALYWNPDQRDCRSQ